MTAIPWGDLMSGLRVRIWVRSSAPWLSGAGSEAVVVGEDVEHALELLEREDEAFALKYRRVINAAATEAPCGVKETYAVRAKE